MKVLSMDFLVSIFNQREGLMRGWNRFKGTDIVREGNGGKKDFVSGWWVGLRLMEEVSGWKSGMHQERNKTTEGVIKKINT